MLLIACDELETLQVNKLKTNESTKQHCTSKLEGQQTKQEQRNRGLITGDFLRWQGQGPRVGGKGAEGDCPSNVSTIRAQESPAQSQWTPQAPVPSCAKDLPGQSF